MQKLQLSIPEPCHENWQQMTPTEQGRFCNACAKEVIDFSTMSDIQVLNYFTNLTHEKVCGRALPEQLDRTISRPEQPKKRLFWYWNYVAMFFMFFGKGNTAKAQGAEKPVTEINPVKQNDIRGEVAAVNVDREGIRIITGKVTDIYGNPVSFAAVKIKGASKGVVADANGAYSLKAKQNDILFISGAGFRSVEVPVRTTANINSVLERTSELKEVVVTIAGGVMRRPVRKTTTEPKNTETRAIESTVIFEVKEDNTELPIGKAAITITGKGENLSQMFFSDVKGSYEFKQIKLNDSYFIKVDAEGYQSNEFTIDAKDFNNGKKPWKVLLKKKKTQPVAKVASQNMVRLGGVHIQNLNKEPLYVVDGTIVKNIDSIKPDDIDNIEVLQAPAAAALFGIDGSNGAIVITTRKAKEIKMKEVIVTSEYGIKGAMRMAGGMSYTNIYEGTLLGDTIATVKTALTSSIKVYPNPVQRNTGFSVALKLKHAGNYNIQVTDASGRVLLQQRFNANSKDHKEKIMGDSRWAAGVYYIRVFDSKNQLISKTSFIFE